MEPSPHRSELRPPPTTAADGEENACKPSSVFTWHGEKGEDSERDHAEIGEGVVHSDDIHQDLLREVRRPKHREAKLQTT